MRCSEGTRLVKKLDEDTEAYVLPRRKLLCVDYPLCQWTTPSTLLPLQRWWRRRNALATNNYCNYNLHIEVWHVCTSRAINNNNVQVKIASHDA